MFGFGEKPRPDFDKKEEEPVERQEMTPDTTVPTETATEPITPTLEAIKTEGNDFPADTTTNGEAAGEKPTLDAVRGDYMKPEGE